MNTDLVRDPLSDLAHRVSVPSFSDVSGLVPEVTVPSISDVSGLVPDVIELVPESVRRSGVVRALPWTDSGPSRRNRLLLIAAIVGMIAGLVWWTRRRSAHDAGTDDVRSATVHGREEWSTHVRASTDVA
jgi:hypothetical protein